MRNLGSGGRGVKSLRSGSRWMVNGERRARSLRSGDCRTFKKYTMSLKSYHDLHWDHTNSFRVSKKYDKMKR